MLYQNLQTHRSFNPENILHIQESLPQKVDVLQKKILEQKLLLQKLLLHSRSRKEIELRSKNSIWDTVKLSQRFKKIEYQSESTRKELLFFDAIHHAREMALIEPITRFSYIHTIKDNFTLGDGYSEDISLMLNTFIQDLAQKGLNSNRASIEAITFERAKKALELVAKNKNGNSLSNEAIMITSFPDDEETGYHGVDSKHNWNKRETHHSFFYLLRVGKVETDEFGKIVSFEIHTTQYRLWPNAQQAIDIHSTFGSKITPSGDSIPNQLFANLIHLNINDLQLILEKQNTKQRVESGPKDIQEDYFEQVFKQILFQNSENHAINFTQLPEVNIQNFWIMQEKYFNEFYLSIATPTFTRIVELQHLLETQINKNSRRKTLLEIQYLIDYLDKAFFYYSKVLLGWIKINNTNPNYQKTFVEKNKFQKLIDFQQKIILKLMGQEQTNTIPSPSKLLEALQIEQKLSTRQSVSITDKRKLLNIWGFFSFAGGFGSLLQCGTIAPFTLPISIMNGNYSSSSISGFSESISKISVPEKKILLNAFNQEEYVELDLTDQGANKIYTVPKSYLTKTAKGEPGCIVGKNGEVLGPCVDPATNLRISLDDPRDTLAFPLTMREFQKYIQTLQEDIQKSTLSKINEVFQGSEFSIQDKRKAQTAISRIRKKLIKTSIGLQEFFTGDVVNRNEQTNEWLQELLMKISFSLNPVETLIKEVHLKIQEDELLKTQIVSQTLETI